jgi:putative sterol carrier protein
MAFLDLDPVPSGVRRTVGGVSSQFVDGVSRILGGDAGGDRLESVMRSPVRRAVLDAIFWQIPRRLDRRRAERVEATVRWQITAPASDAIDVYDLIFAEGRCRVARGQSESEPRVTVTVDGGEFVRLLTGNSDALQAYFKGRLALSGDIVFAAKLVSVFRGPKGRRDRGSAA